MSKSGIHVSREGDDARIMPLEPPVQQCHFCRRPAKFGAGLNRFIGQTEHIWRPKLCPHHAAYFCKVHGFSLPEAL